MNVPAKPVLLTVDDDRVVARTVSRDLRRRYHPDYRVMTAGSAAEGLDTLRALKLRRTPVAMILADYRMPDADGIEFLTQALDLHPDARRALLTAYADTDAAIDAINLVDVDHYMLKPWDPPEEKLYPVIDALLALWAERGRPPAQGHVVVGHRWSADSHRVRDFLARNSVPYRWHEADGPEGRRMLDAACAADADVPVVVTGAGAVLCRPTQTELADAVGLSVEPDVDFYDLVVIGGGPAGLGAAVYGASEGLSTVLVERHATGGQAGDSSRIENYLGFPDGVTGAQLADRARRQARKFGAELLATRDVVAVHPRGPSRAVRFSDGHEVLARAVIVATGVSYRTLDAPGVSELTGRGVFYGSALVEASNCAGRDVFVVGGANSAGQAAIHFANHARRVTLVVRGPSLDVSMSHYLIRQLEVRDNVEVRTGTVVSEARGEDHLESLVLSHTGSGSDETLPASAMFVFVGAEPLTEWLGENVLRDERGFVRTGPDLLDVAGRPRGWPLEREPYYLESSVPGVFVAGDVRADSVKRVASAVGEGAMAVMLVHRYLAEH